MENSPLSFVIVPVVLPRIPTLTPAIGFLSEFFTIPKTLADKFCAGEETKKNKNVEKKRKRSRKCEEE